MFVLCCTSMWPPEKFLTILITFCPSLFPLWNFPVHFGYVAQTIVYEICLRLNSSRTKLNYTILKSCTVHFKYVLRLREICAV